MKAHLSRNIEDGGRDASPIVPLAVWPRQFNMLGESPSASVCGVMESLTALTLFLMRINLQRRGEGSRKRKMQICEQREDKKATNRRKHKRSVRKAGEREETVKDKSSSETCAEMQGQTNKERERERI
ncbi:hypothetical protein EYF80_019055 [Liparis tanakae]|uniref:Uncharacterized protein n=1 Tax=Liparis tanakae TaxID=230148 RepID=A0A4Z2I0K6_9TELE|nr:hypothetical protein EYF80_019055 [Liparis tanakae]